MENKTISDFVNELESQTKSLSAKVKIVPNEHVDDAYDYFIISNKCGYLKLAAAFLKSSIAASKESKNTNINDDLGIKLGDIWDEDSEFKISKFFKGDDIQKIESNLEKPVTNRYWLKVFCYFVVPVLALAGTSLVGMVSIFKWISSF